MHFFPTTSSSVKYNQDGRQEKVGKFSQLQKVALMELVEPHLSIINAKQSTVVTNNKKVEIWEEMNARFPAAVKRSGIQLKENFRKAVSKAKSINASFKRECVGTGGDPAKVKVDPVSMHIISLVRSQVCSEQDNTIVISIEFLNILLYR